MAELIDPKNLVSFTQLAAEYGYNAEHLRQLAVQKKLRAWLIGGAMWVTTRENLDTYMKSRKRAGRRPEGEVRKPTKKTAKK